MAAIANPASAAIAKQTTKTAAKRESTVSSENVSLLSSSQDTCSTFSTSGYLRQQLPTSTDANRVRMRYLASLGITPPAAKLQPRSYCSFRKIPTGSVPLGRNRATAQRNESKSQANGRVRDPEPENNATTGATALDNSDSPQSSTHKRGSVSFDESVTVYTIPLHSDYSKRIRDQLWISRAEMQQSSQRNAVEFASENWDWRQAAEDHDMVRTSTGHLVHPVHCINHSYNLQRQFVMVMSAQRAQSSF